MKIRTKFLIMMFILGITSMGVILFLFHSIVIPWQVETLVQRTREVAYYLQQTGPLISDGERQQLLQKMQQKQSDLSYLTILDKNGKALFHSNPKRIGMIFNDEGTLISARDGKEFQQIYTRDANNPRSEFHGQKTVDILLPYYDHNDHHIGAVKVGLSLNRVEEIKNDYYKAIGISGTILLFILFIITLKHINDVLFPLSKFTYMARRLGEGEHIELVSENRHDELGLLAQEFNSMAKKLTFYMKNLKNKEKELKDYIDNLITLNGKISPDGTLLLVNETATRYLNETPEQLIGKKFWDTPWWNFDPEISTTLKKAVEKAATGQTVYFETKNYLGSGKYIYIDFTLNPILNDNGQIIYLVAEGRDITERKSMQLELVATNEELVASNEELISIEEELRNSNGELYLAHQKLNNILESITDAFCAVNRQWQIIYINTEAEKLLEKKRVEVIGQNLWDELPGDVNTTIYHQLTRVMTQQEHTHFEYFLESLDRWFDIHAYPSPDGLSIYFHDITEYKLAQVELTYHNQYLTSLHETALALMNRLDLDELLEVIVTRAAQLLGTTHGWIYLVNNDKSEMVLRLGIGVYKNLSEFRLKPGEGLAGKVWQSGESMFIDDYSTWPSRLPIYDFLTIHGLLAAPLKSGSEIIGIIGLSFLNKEQKVGPEQLSKLTGFAQFASIALDNARLYNAAQQELGERKRIEEILRYLAYHDSLTDLPNRTLFNDRLLVALNNASRYNTQLAVFFLDLDYFKMVNDTLGHDMGDQLLKDIANKLSSLLRKGDTIARIGGDEFAILLQDIKRSEDTVIVAQKIIDSLKEPWVRGSHEFHITTSIGISLYPNDGTDGETLLKNADAAMYQAKLMGRNNYQFYTPAMNAQSLQRLELENNLRRALERNEFIIHYQPQVEILSRRIVGLEALVRWQHPLWGLISPGDFIPIAEDTGLIVSIGEWVLKTACTQNKTWQDAGFPPMRVTVNLSARQFQQQNLVQKVASILEETGLDPRWLELEITESLAMKDVEFTGKTLFELRKMGITIAIDDFGTGYSSLSYLKRLPIDIIKIDRSFIRDITTDPDDSSIVRTIIILAHNLKMKVIAEGVETEDQLNFLRQQQCDQMQGYLFSKPLPALELEELLPASKNENILK